MALLCILGFYGGVAPAIQFGAASSRDGLDRLELMWIAVLASYGLLCLLLVLYLCSDRVRRAMSR